MSSISVWSNMYLNNFLIKFCKTKQSREIWANIQFRLITHSQNRHKTQYQFNKRIFLMIRLQQQGMRICTVVKNEILMI